MKKSFPIRWIGMSSLFAILLFGYSQNILADNPLSCACIGNDTLICDFTYQISPETAGGEWSVLCDSTDGSVDFDMIDATTTQITVSECGDYHLIYTVDDGTCMSADTAIFTFGDPSFGGISVDSEAELEYDGTVFCHQSPDPSSCNPTSMGGGPPPSVSWGVCGEGTGTATIFSTDVMGDMPVVCLADEITVSSEDFSDFADLGCTNYSEADFLANFFSILAGSGSGAFDSLDIPFITQCLSIGQIDTIFNDSIYFDTMTYLIPYRVGGQWNYITDDGTLSPLNDTTNIVVSDSSLIFIIDPGSDYYGPGDLEFTVFVENDMMDWVDPDFDIEMQIQWVEEFAYDTLLQITQTDSITIIAQTCNNFSFGNNFSFSGPPSYPCGPVTLNFNFGTPPDPLMITNVSTWDDFCGFCDGGAFLEVEGGCPPYSQTEFFGLCEGSYTFTVTDANGNESPPVDVFINGGIPLFIDNVTVINDECEENNGSLTIDVSGGFPPYTYVVDGIQSGSSTFSGLAAGSYNIEVYDTDGCSDFSFVTITTTPEATVSIDGNLTICPGEQTTLTANGNFDTANWTPGGSGNSITVGEGTYCVMVSTANGCTVEECVIVTESNNIPVSISGDLEVCPGEQTTLFADGGFASYSWDNGSTDPSTIVGIGTYCVTVTNNAGCTGTSCVTVAESNLPFVNIFGDTEICEGNTGVLFADGGFDFYEWNTGEIGENITIFGGGLYCVTVTNTEGCTSESCLDVIEIPNPQPTISGNTQIPAGSTTTLSTGNFDAYQWDNGSTDQSITVGIGTYCVTVTNANGCTGETCETITENEPNLSPTITGDFEFCENTSATLTVNGNFATYSWSDGSTSSTISVTAGGAYSVTVSDGMGNTAATSEVVNELPAPMPTISGDAFICEGDITQLATQSYVSYQWSDGSTDATTTAASTDIYEVTVEDNNGCFGSTSFNVEAVSLPNADAFASGNIDCNNTAVALDGSNSNGGNLMFSWSTVNGNILGNNNISTIIADAEGDYILTVTESLNNCESTTSVSISENTQAPELSLLANQTLPCEGELEILPTNTPPNTYSYDWTNANGNPIADATTATPSVELAGTYSVIITDTENGCTNTAATEILANETTPQGVDLVLQTPTCFGDADGQIMVEDVIDGDGPFLFSINGSQFAESMVFENLPAGNFELSVESQASGCVYTEMVMLDDGDQVNLELGDNLTINLGETIEVGAQSFINESIIEDVIWITTADIICDTCLVNPVLLLENTTFDLTVTTENGCVVSDQIQILVTDNTEVFAPNAFTPNNDGANDYFTIYSNNDLLNVKTLAIYNRWGSLVFENRNFAPNNETLGWDGSFNGKLARQGVYIYMAEVEYLDGRKDVVKGDVTVLGAN